MTPSERFSLARNRFGRSSAGGIVGAVALKAGFITFNFALIFLGARTLGAEQFGIYSIVFSAAGLFCVAATFGQQVLIMRSWGEYAGDQDCGLLKGSLYYSGGISLAGAVLVAASFFVWLDITHDHALALTATMFVFLQTLVLVTSHLLRSAIGVGVGDGHANITATLLPVVYLAACLALGITPTVAIIFAFYALGVAVALIVHFLAMRKKLSALAWSPEMPVRYDLATWNPRTVKLWLSSALEASNQYLDVLIIGYLMSPIVAGAYFVITRLANVFATAADAINMYATRHIPDLYFQKRDDDLKRMLDAVSGFVALMIVAGAVVIAGAGDWVLDAFNPDYSRYYLPLLVLSFGTASIAASGPAAYMLMLTGHEGRYLSILAISITLRAIGFFVLIPRYDLLGAVIASSLSFLFLGIELTRWASAKTGYNCSILRLGRFGGLSLLGDAQ